MAETEQTVKYPEVEIDLSHSDGNAAFIIGRVGRAIRNYAGKEATDAWYVEASAAPSYDALLQLVMRTVTTH